MLASHLPLPLRLGANRGESALRTAFTFFSLSPGDAVLVMWRASGHDLPMAINLALQCCRKIQKKYGTHETFMGHKLYLRIGISAGNLSFISVKGWDRQYFFICNWTLDDVIEAQGLSANHQVMLSQNCWDLCEQKRIRARPLAGKRAMKPAFHFLRPPKSSSVDCTFNRSIHALHDVMMWNTDSKITKLQNHDRQKAVWSESPRKRDLCSELRPITSLFIQLRFTDKITVLELSKTLSDCSKMISEIIIPYKGEINKTLLFDKGCTVLCIFGFSGAKMADESAHALQCALQIFHKASTSLRNLRSGIAFCGFTGHPERFEHTGRPPLS
uniref:Guanylate cyclase domain-containing protein n=1 Tax=Coturnix japonica TaxID=93934 RepID=A0A8C2TMD1_COTJA